MAAPAGVSSGSAPEPAAPEPTALEPAEPELAEPELAEPELAEPELAEPELAEPELAEPEPDAPEMDEPAADESTDAFLDPEQEPDAAEPGEPEGARRGAGRLVAAIMIFVVIAAAAAAGVLVVTTHGLRQKTIVTYRPAAVFGLRTGDCINASPNGLSVTILPCATPHQAEVFATFSLTGSSWPGGSAVNQQADSGCTDRIAGYLNPQLLNAGLTQEYVYPNQDAWKAGIRTVVCEVSSSTGPLTGSVRQSG
jgi:Septum formation